MNVDKLFVITLDTALDRQDEFRRRFPELVNSSVFEWYITERDKEDSVRGCYNSHRNILHLARSRNYKNVIIFEDDVDLLVSWDEFVKAINNLERPPDWKIIQLGYFPLGTTRTPIGSVYKINCSLGSHAYLVNVEKMDLLEYTGIPIDNHLFCNGLYGEKIGFIPKFPQVEGVYGVYPMLIRQRSSTSTIDNLHNINGNLDYDRNLLVRVSADINIIGLVVGLSLTVILAIGLVVGGLLAGKSGRA